MHKWQSCKTVYSQDVVDMYTSVGRLLVQFTDQPSATIRDCIPVLVWLLQDSTYSKFSETYKFSKCEIKFQFFWLLSPFLFLFLAKNVNRSNLTVQMIHLIASIVNNQDDVKVIFTKEAMDSICSVINEASTSSLDLETAVSVTHLAPYLTSGEHLFDFSLIFLVSPLFLFYFFPQLLFNFTLTANIAIM